MERRPKFTTCSVEVLILCRKGFCHILPFFVAKEVYEKIGNFDLSIPILADYDFTSRCYKTGVYIIGIDQVLSNFKLGGLSSSFFDFYADYHAIQYKYGFITKKRYRELIFVLKLKKIIAKMANRW